MEISVFSEQDLEECTATFIEVFNSAPWNDKWSREMATRYLQDFTRAPGFFGLLAREQEVVVGMMFGVRKAWWSGEKFYIHEMCVKANEQNSGIGSKLMNHLVNVLKGDGVQNIALLTDRGIPAEAFYKKQGFEEIERIVFLNKNL